VTQTISSSASTQKRENLQIRPVSSNATMGALVRLTVTFLVFLLIFGILGGWLGSGFLSAQDRVFDLHQNVPVLLLALAAMSVLVVQHFDLSIGAVATLTAYLSVGLHDIQGLPMWAALLICLAVGLTAGLLNAFLVVKLQVNAFIATIGTSGIFLGASRVYSEGTVLVPESLPAWFSGEGSFGSFSTKTPAWLLWVLLLAAVAYAALYCHRVIRKEDGPLAPRVIKAGGVAIAGLLAILAWPRIVGLIPLTVVFLLMVSLVLWAVYTRTVFGRYMYATGGNPRAARLAGVNVDRQTTMAFVLTGVLSTAAGVVLAANQGTVSVDVAGPMLLPAYAAAFLSTVLLSTGRFHIWGCIVGGIFVVWIRQALIMGGVPFTWAEVVNGAVLIAAVVAAKLLSREKRR
jgi:ribose/xylose/arabinose/galactoside ABC-type transport system permease subunit